MKRLILPALAVAALAGCAGNGPMTYSQALKQGDSFISTDMPDQLATNQFPVSILSIDGADPTWAPALVKPGKRELLVAGPRPPGLSQPMNKTFTLDVKPCTTYYVVAQKASAMAPDYQVVVAATKPVPNCKLP
jgi:Prokaryotic membrane lipoprotein lipid attachment site